MVATLAENVNALYLWMKVIPRVYAALFPHCAAEMATISKEHFTGLSGTKSKQGLFSLNALLSLSLSLSLWLHGRNPTAVAQHVSAM